jgi:hypothetical protein
VAQPYAAKFSGGIALRNLDFYVQFSTLELRDLQACYLDAGMMKTTGQPFVRAGGIPRHATI